MSDPASLVARLPPPDRIALFLDVDGTLIGPTAADRERGVPRARLDLLARIQQATAGATVILTGRSVDAVDAMFAPLHLPVAGLQGADRRHPGGKRVMPVLTAEERRIYEKIAEDVARYFPHIEIEWKPGGMALVFDPRDPTVGQLIALAEDRADGAFKVMPGRVAVDIVPRDTDKGRALSLFMVDGACAGRVPVHVGDDVPDEPAFVAARNHGGFGVSVGRPAPGVDARLPDHEAVWAVLAAWLAAY